MRTISPHILAAVDENLALNAFTMVKPPLAAQRIAARALERRKALPKSKRGGLSPAAAGKLGIGSGVKRAVDIAAGRHVKAEQVHRWYQRFHNQIEAARAAGKSFDESKMIQADELWGGFPMWRAAKVALGVPR